MMEPITATASLLLSKIVLDKFYEGVSGKLGEAVAQKALVEPIEQLGQLVWAKCVGLVKSPQEAQKVLDGAIAGNAAAQQNLALGVNQAIDAASEAEQAEIKQLATQIQQTLTIGEMNGGEVWNVFGGKVEKNEFKDNKAPVIKDNTGTVTINYGTNPN
jgi:hypothetical protein